jgi:hypothetical protein
VSLHNQLAQPTHGIGILGVFSNFNAHTYIWRILLPLFKNFEVEVGQLHFEGFQLYKENVLKSFPKFIRSCYTKSYSKFLEWNRRNSTKMFLRSFSLLFKKILLGKKATFQNLWKIDKKLYCLSQRDSMLLPHLLRSRSPIHTLMVVFFLGRGVRFAVIQILIKKTIVGFLVLFFLFTC